MESQSRQIEALAQRVRAIEQDEPASVGRSRRIPTGWGGVDATLGGGLPAGAVHEWFASSGAAAQPGPCEEAPPLAVLMHLARQATGAGEAGWVVWVGRRCWPYPHSLTRPGEVTIRRSLLVDPADAASRLWAMSLATRCADVAAVIGDGQGLDMAATRRLQLAARDADTPVLLARAAVERGEVSAAATRWHVSPTPSPTDQPRWRLELWRCKGMQDRTGTDATRSWIVEHHRATGLVVVSPATADRAASTPGRGRTKRSA